MTKYLLFSSEGYEGVGGAYDNVGVFDSIDEAKAANPAEAYWSHIAVIDGSELQVIASWPHYPDGTYSRDRYKGSPEWVHR